MDVWLVMVNRGNEPEMRPGTKHLQVLGIYSTYELANNAAKGWRAECNYPGAQYAYIIESVTLDERCDQSFIWTIQ